MAVGKQLLVANKPTCIGHSVTIGYVNGYSRPPKVEGQIIELEE